MPRVPPATTTSKRTVPGTGSLEVRTKCGAGPEVCMHTVTFSLAHCWAQGRRCILQREDIDLCCPQPLPCFVSLPERIIGGATSSSPRWRSTYC